MNRRLRISALALLLLLPAVAAAQQSPPQRAPRVGAVAAEGVDTAALLVEGRSVMVFRTSLGARSAAERAADASRRVLELLELGGSDSVGTRMIPEGVLITVGARGVFTITAGDLDSLRGQTLQSAGALAAARLGAAMAVAREEHSLGNLLRGLALSALATILFVVVLRLVRGARRLLLARLPEAGSRLPKLAVAGFTLLSADHLLRFARRLVDIAAWGLGLFIAYLWLAYVLTRFSYTRPWGEVLGSYLTDTVTSLALGALSGIPGLFTVAIIVIATRWVTRLVATFFDAVETGTVAVPWLHQDTADPTKRIVVALLWVFAIVVAYPYLPGSNTNIFKGVSVFIGLVLSLGSSGVVNQAMSGLVLMYSRALKAGDYVTVAGTEGFVVDLGLLSTKIRTNKREMVTIPNSVLVGTATKNYSRLAAVDNGVIVYTSVTIGYDTPWRQVYGLLVMAADRTPGIRREPRPFVRQTALSDFYAEYELNAYVERPEERVAVLSALHENIQDSFNEYGVQIMSPHYEHDPLAPKVVPRDGWAPAPAVDGRHGARSDHTLDQPSQRPIERSGADD